MITHNRSPSHNKSELVEDYKEVVYKLLNVYMLLKIKGHHFCLAIFELIWAIKMKYVKRSNHSL